MVVLASMAATGTANPASSNQLPEAENANAKNEADKNKTSEEEVPKKQKAGMAINLHKLWHSLQRTSSLMICTSIL
jgi:hypothetical protein